MYLSNFPTEPTLVNKLGKIFGMPSSKTLESILDKSTPNVLHLLLLFIAVRQRSRKSET